MHTHNGPHFLNNIAQMPSIVAHRTVDALDSKHTIKSTTNPMSYVNNCNNSIVIPPVTMAEVRQTILSLKNLSAGWDDLPTVVAKQSIDSYIEPLTCLINRSFSDGIFPDELKLARIVPIFKSGDSTVLSNYRPIYI